MIKNILLDMDGVISDFLTPALEKLNAWYNKNITVEEYAKVGVFDIEQVYGISSRDFWITVETADFWSSLKPLPWAKDLYQKLNKIAPVTIASSPSKNPVCALQKTAWIKEHLGLENTNLMLGSRKYLMASANNLLVDDYPKNIKKFQDHGGKTICIPSSWNTPHLTFEKVWNVITEGLAEIDRKEIRINPVVRDRHGGLSVQFDTKGKEF